MATRSILITGDETGKLQVHTWDIEFSGRRIYCVPKSKAPGARPRSFEHTPGILYFRNTTDTAYCYFRTKEFDELLKKAEIRSIEKRNPNGTYELEAGRLATRGSWASKIETDGRVTRVMDSEYEDDYQKKHPGTVCYKYGHDVYVEEAGYVILVKTENGFTTKTLITEKDPIAVLKSLAAAEGDRKSEKDAADIEI